MDNSNKISGVVNHLDHFVLPVMNPDRAEKFYTEVMGARTLKREGDSSLTRIFMKLGENHVGLFSQNKAAMPKRDRLDAYPRAAFAIPENDFAALSDKIRRESPLVKAIENEPALGCSWREGLAFVDPEGNLLEVSKQKGLGKARLHHLHFDTTDLQKSLEFYETILALQTVGSSGQVAIVRVPSDQQLVLNRVDALSEVTQTPYRGRHYAFHVSDENFAAIVEKLHRAGIDERDEHGEREGRRPGQLGTYFKEPSGFRLQITNEDSATFAQHAIQ
jgi:catechol 2,3-dioxygenase-like lactoylglutathione lyase family enzyme